MSIYQLVDIARQTFFKTFFASGLVATKSSPSSNKSSVIRQKGESQNGGFQERKARQNFRKTNISYPPIRT